MKHKLKSPALAIVLMLALLGCSKNPADPSTPAAPDSPQALVLTIDQTLTDANDTAIKLAIALRDQGKVTQATTSVILQWCDQVAVLEAKVATELGSADDWSTQKQKILVMLGGFALPNIVGTLDPSLQAKLSLILGVVDQIKGKVAQ